MLWDEGDGLVILAGLVFLSSASVVSVKHLDEQVSLVFEGFLQTLVVAHGVED